MIVFKCVFYCIRYSIYLPLSSSFNKFTLVYISKKRFVININIISFYFYKTNIFKQYYCIFFSRFFHQSWTDTKQTQTCHLRVFNKLISPNATGCFLLNQVAEQFGFWESSCVCVCVCNCMCVYAFWSVRATVCVVVLCLKKYRAVDHQNLTHNLCVCGCIFHPHRVLLIHKYMSAARLSF